MTNYETELNEWGATGEVWPDGYSWEEGEQVIDVWENFFRDNVIKDLNHLIDVTNNDLVKREGGSFLSDVDIGKHRIRGEAGDIEFDGTEIGIDAEVDIKREARIRAPSTFNSNVTFEDDVHLSTLVLNGETGVEDDVPTIDADGNLTWGEGGIGVHDHSDDDEMGGSVIRPVETRSGYVSSMQKSLPADEELTIGNNESVVVADEYEVEGELTVEDGGTLKVI